MEPILSWIGAHPEISSVALGISILVLAATVILSPYLAALIPEDYFVNPDRRTLHPSSSVIGLLRKLIKNLLGLVLLFLGLVMLVTPGQGLLTIFVALMALDYPGKYDVERWLFSKSSIRDGINWLRRKAGAEPLKTDSNSD